MSISFEPVATIRSCYTQRFGIPRQAGLVSSATAQIIFENNDNNRLSLRGIEDFSHIWVIFLFHQQHYEKSKPLVQPPRLGGKKNIGVYATRSPNRPNPIGLSCVALTDMEIKNNEIQLHVNGGDFLDKTPVIDIKPYVSFADAIADSSSGWATPITTALPVHWCSEAVDTLQELSNTDGISADQFTRLVDETIALDPRPAYERNKDGHDGQLWHMRLLDYDVSFAVTNGTAMVTGIKRYQP